MPDGMFNAWNISSNKKNGTDIKIPYSDLARASNSWFGDTYGSVKVTCNDGDNNTKTFKGSKWIKVFFPPDVNVDGTTPTNNKPPCWFVFWKNGNVIDGISDFMFDARDSNIAAYYSLRSDKLYLCRGAFDYKRQQFNLSYPSGSGSFVVGSNEEYIEGVAALIPHEKYHKYCKTTWSIPGSAAIRAKHADTDALPDAEENKPSKIYFKTSSPNNPDTFSISSLSLNFGTYRRYGDQEVRCRLEEIHNKPTIDKDKDWAADSRNPKW
jgi:hypothetical protein